MHPFAGEDWMKTGRKLQKLEAELDRQREAKKDFLWDAARMAVEVMDPPESSTRFRRARRAGAVRLWLEGHGGFNLTWHSHWHLRKWVGIPAKYYDRMLLTAPRLLEENVNHWLKTQRGKLVVRTLDGTARAVLSDRYRPLDNFDLVETVVPAMKEAEAHVVSCELTPTQLYLKAVVPGLREELWPEGVKPKWGRGNHLVHVLQPGVVVSNSEIGEGALSVSSATHTVNCSNLAVWGSGPATAWKKHHVGRRLATGTGKDPEVWKWLKDGPRPPSDAAVWAQVRDLVHQALQVERFRELVAAVKKSLGHRIVGDPEEAVEVLTTQHRLTEQERRHCLQHLIDGGDLSQYGLHQAVSRMAQDVSSYDRASELEQLSGTIVQLEGEDWARIAQGG